MFHGHFRDWGHPAPDYDTRHPFRFWVQKTLPQLYDDSLTYYELLNRVVWYINQMLNTLKAYDCRFAELMGVYNELERYVNQYFDAIDVPRIVKAVLDDMAATGKLSEIVIGNIKNFSIDVRKIKNGIVPIHYTYNKTENGIEQYIRTETDDDVLEILRNGSVVLGCFAGSPTYGNFNLLMNKASYLWEGTLKEFECGCVNTVYSKDFVIEYHDYVLDGDGFIKRLVATDDYENEFTSVLLEGVYADIPDGYVTTVKLADGAVTEPKLADNSVTSAKIKDGEVKTADLADKSVTHPKLADDAVWTENIKDGSVTPSKLANRRFILLGDNYATISNSWMTKVADELEDAGLDVFTAAHQNAGFVGNNKTFKSLLEGLAVNDKESISDIVIVGGWNDEDATWQWDGNLNERLWGAKDCTSAFENFRTYVEANYPYASVHVAHVSWHSYVNYGNGTYYDKGAHAVGTEQYVKNCGANQFAFISNSQYALHDYSMLASDGYTPNSAGSDEIAICVLTHLYGGTYHKITGARIANMTWESDVTPINYAPGEAHTPAANTYAPRFETAINDNVATIEWDVNAVEFTNPIDFSGHSAGDSNGIGRKLLCTFSDDSLVAEGPLPARANVNIPCIVAMENNGAMTYTNAMCNVRFQYNRVNVALYRCDEGSAIGTDAFAPFENVKSIHFFNGPNSIMMKSLAC